MYGEPYTEILFKQGAAGAILRKIYDIGRCTTEAVAPMTIIAAIRLGESAILVGADSGQTDFASGARTKCAHKLIKHPRAHIVWGMSGSDSVADAFTFELNQYDPPNWEELKTRCVDILSRCNSKQESLTKKFGDRDYLDSVLHFNPFLGSLLLVGYLDGALGGFTVSCWGQASSFHPDD